MKGIGRVFKRGSIWWIAFYHRGEEYRESSESESEFQAGKMLKDRLKRIGKRRFVPNEDRLAFDDLVKDLVNDYQVNDRRSLCTALNHVRHLRGFFGMDRAVDIGSDGVKSYQAQRKDNAS